MSKTMVHLFARNTELILQDNGISIDEQIGGGSFAKVYKAYKQEANGKKKVMAVKVVELQKISEKTKKNLVPRELYAVTKLKHQFIIQVYDIYTVNTRVYIFMEFAEGGDLLEYINRSKVEEIKAKQWTKQLASALSYCHSHGIVHMDIKTENILLNGDFSEAKLSDFGFARKSYQPTTGHKLLSDVYCGSVLYVAPDVLKFHPYDPFKSDVWSLGVVLYIMLTKSFPFGDEENAAKVLQKQFKRDWNQFFKSSSLNKHAKNLIAHMLEPHEDKRIRIDDVLNHPWLCAG